jgi:hypothetical protein
MIDDKGKLLSDDILELQAKNYFQRGEARLAKMYAEVIRDQDRRQRVLIEVDVGS